MSEVGRELDVEGDVCQLRWDLKFKMGQLCNKTKNNFHVVQMICLGVEKDLVYLKDTQSLLWLESGESEEALFKMWLKIYIGARVRWVCAWFRFCPKFYDKSIEEFYEVWQSDMWLYKEREKKKVTYTALCFKNPWQLRV